jgi:4-hydroxy-tetrahydrodipicolinate reductase
MSSASVLGVGVHGASGRVGRTIVQACQSDDVSRVVAACCSTGSSALGIDIGVLVGVGELDLPITTLETAPSAGLNAWIDFSVPDATLKLLSTCIDSSKPLVIGTTGFSTLQREKIVAAAEQIPVVMAPNMSVGVNVVFDLLATVARVVGVDSDVEIVEAHHRDKIDSPSGTAVRMGEIVAESLGTDLASAAVYARQGSIGAREPGSIGFATVRGGDIVGEHTVLFATEGERIEITHRGSSRMNFARGSLRAARWLLGRAPGLYDMRDVLGLE